MTSRPTVAIAGGGLGGPAAAAALTRAAFDVTVFERETAVVREGSALFLAANATKALHDLGLGEAFAAVSQAQRDGELRTDKGKLLFRLSAQLMLDQFGHPNACVERTQLRRVLLNAAGRERVRLGAPVTQFEDGPEGVVVRLANGSRERFDALVGADGIGSAVREQLRGNDRARYAGYTAWRGVVEGQPDWPQDVGCEQWGRGRRTGFSYLGRGVWGWWATRLGPQGGTDAVAGRASQVASCFGGWWGPIEGLIRATADERILRNDIFVRPPDKAWGHGRVTLLGDAAHLMTPDLGQGACQSLVDAVVLARCLKGASIEEIPSRLRRYEALRIPQTALVARRSLRLGRAAHASSRVGVAFRNFVLRSVPPAVQLRRIRRTIERSMF